MSAKPQINLKPIMLSERGQKQTATYCMIPFIWYSGELKTKGTEINQWLPGTLEARQRRLTIPQAPRNFLKLNGAVILVVANYIPKKSEFYYM